MKSLIIILLAFALMVTGCLWKQPGSALPEAPQASRMPPVVNQDMGQLLLEFESEVIRNQPGVAALLHPGISDDHLEQAERAIGAPLHPEIRELYRWHNGMERGLYLFPGYDYYSLEDAIRLRDDSNAYFREKHLEILMAHEADWLMLFPDPAGDGYYYDFKKDYEQGGVFFVFRESGYYIHFPSIKNLLAAVTECYRQGAYQGDQTLDFELEIKIMESYGKAESN